MAYVVGIDMQNNQNSELAVIGRAERVDLPKLGLSGVPAKIDTGADLSAIWCSSVIETEGGLDCVLFGPGSEFYTGQTLHFAPGEYQDTRIANSFDEREVRYKVKLAVRVKGRLVKGSFTLADRSTKIYPILLGKRLLYNKFLVDVTAGQPLVEEERERKLSYARDKRAGEHES
jgi:hypothetical protein